MTNTSRHQQVRCAGDWTHSYRNRKNSNFTWPNTSDYLTALRSTPPLNVMSKYRSVASKIWESMRGIISEWEQWLEKENSLLNFVRQTWRDTSLREQDGLVVQFCQPRWLDTSLCVTEPCEWVWTYFWKSRENVENLRLAVLPTHSGLSRNFQILQVEVAESTWATL